MKYLKLIKASMWMIFLTLVFYNGKAQEVNLQIQENGVLFTEGKDSILFYKTKDKSLNGSYKRSNYIHPLFSLDGEVITEDFPVDHFHHRGIFWAWHQLYVGEKQIGDGWDIKDFRWEVVSVNEVEKWAPEKILLAEVLWKSPAWLDSAGNEKALIRENTEIKVFPANKDYRQIDLKISIIALEPAMRIGGAENEKGYGGFSYRIRLAKDMKFTSSAGKVEPDNLPVKAGGWMDISGTIGKKGKMFGITVLCHPDNPQPANYWILRRKKSMQNAVFPYPGAKAVPLLQTKPTVLQYRLLVHNGNVLASDIQSIYLKYCNFKRIKK